MNWQLVSQLKSSRREIDDFMESTLKDRLLAAFPFFKKAPQSLVDRFLAVARYQKLPTDLLVKLEGDKCHEFVLILSGGKRIFKMGTSNREITLYEIGVGDICVLNASCLLSGTRLLANAATTAETEIILIPAVHFRKLIGDYEEMRAFIYARINEAMSSIMMLVSEISFGKMDERLIDYLIEKSEENTLRKTHQEIANDLGTSREVISRLLKHFERQGKVVLSRGTIEIYNKLYVASP